MNKVEHYRCIIEALERQILGGNFEDYSWGNTTGLYVKDPSRCLEILRRFHKIKRKAPNGK